MRPTNTRITLFLSTFLISVILVYLIDGVVVPLGTNVFTEEYTGRCWH